MVSSTRSAVLRRFERAVVAGHAIASESSWSRPAGMAPCLRTFREMMRRIDVKERY